MNVYAVLDETGKLVAIKAARTGPDARKLTKTGKTTRNFGPIENLTRSNGTRCKSQPSVESSTTTQPA